jgi:calcineurin-like phosphoesterase family protein
MSPDLTRIDHGDHFIGDTHFGHVGILDMSMRPYADIRAHDRDLVEQWNALVRGGDTVWHVGDFAGEDVPFERVAEIFGKLNGSIHLIRGNHDGDEVCSKLPWASVDVMRTLVGSDGRKVVLCHYGMTDHVMFCEPGSGARRCFFAP